MARDRSPRKQHTSRDAQTGETDGAVGEQPATVIQESHHVEAEVALEKAEGEIVFPYIFRYQSSRKL